MKDSYLGGDKLSWHEAQIPLTVIQHAVNERGQVHN